MAAAKETCVRFYIKRMTKKMARKASLCGQQRVFTLLPADCGKSSAQHVASLVHVRLMRPERTHGVVYHARWDVIDRLFTQSPLNFWLPFPNAIHELLTRWLTEIHPKDLGDVLSGEAGFFYFSLFTNQIRCRFSFCSSDSAAG